MDHPTGKFCLDRSLVRWSLIQGTITRKTGADDPLGGSSVPASRVMGIEKVISKKVERSPYARTMMLVGVGILVTAWLCPSLTARIILGLVGLLLVYRGAERARPRVTIDDAYQLIVPGMNAEEWRLVGSTPEVVGFVEAVRQEMQQGDGALRV